MGQDLPLRGAAIALGLASLGHAAWAGAQVSLGWYVDALLHLLMVAGVALAAVGVARLPAGEGAGMIAAGCGMAAFVRFQDILLGLSFPGWWMVAGGISGLGFLVLGGRAAFSGADAGPDATARALAVGALITGLGSLFWLRLNFSGPGVRFLPGTLVVGLSFLVAAYLLSGGIRRLLPRRERTAPPA